MASKTNTLAIIHFITLLIILCIFNYGINDKSLTKSLFNSLLLYLIHLYRLETKFCKSAIDVFSWFFFFNGIKTPEN